LIATRQANVAPLVTHHFSFEDIEAAFKLVAAYQDNVIKAIIHLS
jgi:threonine dehydrogenase-like Zn-dependent dehydrogenase